MTQDSTPTPSQSSEHGPTQDPSQKGTGGNHQTQTPLIPAPFLKPYDPIETEPRIQSWERNDSNPKESIYNPDFLIAKGITDPSAPSSSIILPPPNVTGTLHLGHGLMVTIQDILMRKARMDGKKVLWIPGTDHAAIATQSVVEKEISKKEGKSRYDIGREEMLRRIGDFANQSHDTIVSQVKRMGASLDWSREAFTLDDARNLAVRTMFKRMFDDGLIYRGFRIVNWDPKGQTTIADDELVYKEETTKFYYFKYGPFTIGTARPETKFGDKYVVMHPEDARYAQYSHGQKITVEWINGPIEATIIKDESIDMEFGTGVMTITPWHSAVDFALAEKHKLDKGSPVIDLFGKLLPIAGDFAGRKISEVREDLVKAFGKKNLIAKAPDENYVHRIATAERSGGVIEPQVLQQWFVAVNTPFTIPHSEINGIESGSQTTLKEIMRKAVDPAFGHKTLGPVDILPDHFNKTYFHWIDNLNDWCISRQIWYGHRIPAYYDLSNEANFTLQLGFKNTKISTPEFYDQYIGPLSLKLFAENSDKSSDYLNRFNSMTDKNGNTVVSGYIAHKLFLDGIISKEDLQTCQRITTDQNSVIEIITDDSDIKLLDKCYIQDPDTLDTWFSSGLWSFSTLGWPGTQDPNTRLPIAGSELATYHPTTILVTGYEILFFWVARMILMTGYGLGTIPFKTVYLNGTIRDSQGRKMSKSLGNGGDPIQISDKYGADALRMFYAMSNTPGTDSRIYEDKIKGFKHFANKVWNITRFVLTAIAENPHAKDQKFNPDFFTGVYAPEAYSGPTEQDRMILAEWRTALKAITEHLDAYRIHLAAEELYGYLWRTFADKILEESKPILKPGFADMIDGHSDASNPEQNTESIAEKIIEADQLDSTDLALKRQAALSRAQTLMTILRESLLTLHPFMPHVTQEIWSLLPQEVRNDALTHGMIAIEKWPMHHI